MAGSAPPAPPPLRDIFGFSDRKRTPPAVDLPELKRYAARDGEQLAFRIYESPAAPILVFAHGSSYHGAAYHALAAAISAGGAATVVLPNLRGHFQSGSRRGDVDHIGQLEDDLADLIAALRRDGRSGPIILGGHSSGGGLAIRFAGGRYGALASRYLLLAPVIPVSPAMRGGDAGGWAMPHKRRLFGLLMLNALGIHGFDALPIISFNKPAALWDGTETLSYSFRLNASYHPRNRYAADLGALGDRALAIVGADDEAVDAAALRALFARHAKQSNVLILPGVNHFGVFADAATFRAASDWIGAARP